MLLYSILDVKANAFGRIFEARTDDEAVRTFLMIIQQSTGNDLLGQFPQDFALYRLADFNQFTGELVPDVQPYHLISGLEVVQMLRSRDNTCSDCAVQKVSEESNVVALKSQEEEVSSVKACVHDDSEPCVPTISSDCSDEAFEMRKDFKE